LDNVITVLRQNLHLQPHNYDIHVNFPGGTPVDGPSAGVAIVAAIYSAITGRKVSNVVAMTGEVSIRGLVKPVGGIVAKLEAARLAGVKRAIIPKDNWQSMFSSIDGMVVHGVEQLEEVITLSLLDDANCAQISKSTVSSGLLSASG
jgi:Lon-like ATP-dependent protease